MLRFLPAIAEVTLLVFCRIDAIQSDSERARNLTKGWWIVLLVVLPIAGGVAWRVAGRPQTRRAHVPWRSTGAAGFPDDERPT